MASVTHADGRSGVRANKRLLLAGAYALMEERVVRLAGAAVRADGRFAARRVARSRNASR